MPGFDGKGPEGKGSRTGKAMGKCKPTAPQKDSNNLDDLEKMPGRGLGRGRRRGRGLGRILGK